MNTQIRVLGIAPYEGMKTLMSNLTEEYPQMDLSLFVGDRELGLEIARANFHGNYDVVISRGDTATMLRRDLSIPVVEIEVSMYDLLCTLKLAGSLSGGIAFVAAASVAESAMAPNSLLVFFMAHSSLCCKPSVLALAAARPSRFPMSSGLKPRGTHQCSTFTVTLAAAWPTSS